MKTYRFTVIIEKDDDGFYVGDVPELKGCHSQAKSIDELMKRMKEAVELQFEAENGEVELSHFVGLQELEVAA